MIMASVVAVGLVFALVCGWRFNAMGSGDDTAKSLGVNVDLLRFLALLISSMITAVCVSFLGIIGFVGIICPHLTKRLVGADHRVSVPASMLMGSILLLVADTISRSIGSGSALPVGAVTSLLGAPFFIFILLGGFGKREEGDR
jgi:iron complex transport system permease protein